MLDGTNLMAGESAGVERATCLFALAVPLAAREALTLAFSRIGPVTYPTLKLSIPELISRVRATPGGAVAFWKPVPGFDYRALRDAGVPIYWIGPGTLWDKGSGADASKPVSFYLEGLDVEGAADRKPELESVNVGHLRDWFEDDLEELVGLADSAPLFGVADAPAVAPVDVVGRVVAVPRQARPGEGAGYVDELMQLIRHSRATGAPILITNTLGDGTLRADKSAQFGAYVSGLIDAPYSRDLVRGAAKVVTTSAAVALDARAAGLSVELIGSEFILPETAEQANRALLALNAFCANASADGDARLLYRLRPPVEEPEEAPPAYVYVKKPPFRRVPKVDKALASAVPSWFLESQEDLGTGKFIGYIPWIKEHTEALVSIIAAHSDVPFKPIRILQDEKRQADRRAATLYALDYPEKLRALVFSRLTAIKDQLHCVIFSFEWLPYMRVISQVCADLDIPRVLVPHESVFAKRDMYYIDSTSGIDSPSTDVALAWGQLQAEIYAERRYPPERVQRIGAPKFDIYRNGTPPKLTREQYCKAFNLDPAKKIILFAAQPLDSQFDVAVARNAQRQAIKDVLALCKVKGWQVIFRAPPSRASDVIGDALSNAIEASPIAAIDRSGFYRVSPFEALHHCDAVTSINSTMLFEGLLMGKLAISLRYLEFESYWARTSIAAAHNRAELLALLEKGLEEGVVPELDIGWAEDYLSNGGFDGQAGPRIAQALERMIKVDGFPSAYNPTLDLVLGKSASAGTVAVPNLATLRTVHKHLPKLIGADNVGTPRNTSEAHAYDHYLRWGRFTTGAKAALDTIFGQVGKPPIYVEDGFIRSPGLGVSGDPGLSIILDDVTPYYDATRSSRMQQLLNSDLKLTTQQHAEAEALIAKIVRYKVSKYNHAPVRDLSSLRQRKKSVLLVDQRFGDQSIKFGLSDEQTFITMAKAASALSGHDVLVKLHPDAITGGKKSSFGNARFDMFFDQPQVNRVDTDANPYSLLDIADEVWVASSGMGFEALLAGKKVRCFGAPFYAGRGLTQDEVALPDRTRKRSLVEMFHVAYIILSRYFDPRTGERADLNALLDYLIEVSLGVDVSAASDH